VETEFFTVMKGGDEEKGREIFSKFQCLEAKDIANSIKFVMESPKHVQIHDILVRPTQQKNWELMCKTLNLAL